MGDMPSKETMPTKEEALPGREEKMKVSPNHSVTGNRMVPPFPDDTELAMFGMGCFWGAERKFWKMKGVFSTSVGYSGGFTKNPLYREVCSGMTGHNEVVQVVFRPKEVAYVDLLKTFWESHDPTQYMRQGNDRGTQYRSGIYFYNDMQRSQAEASKKDYQKKLTEAGHDTICTEIQAAGPYYYAEDYHQQYLDKNPQGYCGLGGTGVSCPIGKTL